MIVFRSILSFFFFFFFFFFFWAFFSPALVHSSFSLILIRSFGSVLFLFCFEFLFERFMPRDPGSTNDDWWVIWIDFGMDLKIIGSGYEGMNEGWGDEVL
jgi:hypothetical protein